MHTPIFIARHVFKHQSAVEKPALDHGSGLFLLT